MRGSTCFKHLSLVSLLCVAWTLTGQRAEAAGLLIADGGLGGVLEIEEHVVDVTINNGIAVTQVTQVFRNTERRQVEALYTFPVPKGASVSDFSMWINGKEMVGEVLEKERAREIYDSYKQQRRDPGLLEQVDYKTFEMRIFPIGPGAEQQVRITYYQELGLDDSWATYVYPLATVTRADVDSRVRGRLAMDLHALSEIPITGMKSPSHEDELVVVSHGESYRQASLEASGGDLERDLVVAFKLQRPHTGFDLIASTPPNEDGYLMLTLMAGDNELAAHGEGMDYVFLLDVSGSMDRDGKLALSRDSIGAFINELGADDRFELLCFNVAPTSLFGGLVSSDARSQEQAAQFLESRRARGGTVLEPALDAAYRYKDPDRSLNVVILSDGMTEQEEQVALHRAIASRPAGTRVFAIGVGNEVNRPLLEQITDDAGGLAAFISRGDSFSRQAKAFRRKLIRPAASNVEIELQGGGVYDLEPRDLPDLFHGAPLRLLARYRDPGPLTVRLRADVGGERIVREVELELPERNAENPEIERMWAWHRVRRLLDEAGRSGTSASVKDEVVRLGEAYSIVTEHTSFLVLENDAEYERWRIERRNLLRGRRDRGSQASLRTRLAALREKARSELGPRAAASDRSLADQSARVAEPGSARPGRAPASSRQATSPQPVERAEPERRRSRGDLDLGGGALDPLSLALTLVVAAMGLIALRRRSA